MSLSTLRDLTYKHRQSLNERRATRFASQDIGTGQRGRSNTAGRTVSLSRSVGSTRRGAVRAPDRLDSLNRDVNGDQTCAVRQGVTSVRGKMGSRRGVFQLVGVIGVLVLVVMRIWECERK